MAWVTKFVAGYESGYSDEAHNGADEMPPVDYNAYNSGRAGARIAQRDTGVIVPLTGASWRCGWWIMSGGPAFDHPTLLIVENASSVVQLVVGFNGLLTMRGATAGPPYWDYVHEQCTPLTNGHSFWNHLGFVCTPSVASFYINGKRYLTAEHEGVDSDELWVMATGFTGSLYVIDDFYLQESDIEETDLAPPALRFYPIRPQQTVLNEWTVNPSHLAQASDAFEDAPDDQDLTYLSANSDGARARFKFGNVPMTIPDVHTIRNVTIQPVVRNLGTGGIRLFADNGVDENLSSAKTPNTTYGGSVQYIMDADPSGDPWTNDSVGQAEYGIENEGY